MCEVCCNIKLLSVNVAVKQTAYVLMQTVPEHLMIDEMHADIIRVSLPYVDIKKRYWINNSPVNTIEKFELLTSTIG